MKNDNKVRNENETNDSKLKDLLQSSFFYFENTYTHASGDQHEASHFDKYLHMDIRHLDVSEGTYLLHHLVCIIN